ncbi:putative low-density lipoprotein receptor-related protein 4-like [Apostichopus japonicus]|uniref:Putative low-density lipoprotein receptor-related protein 4-like n=1 Tax=Stichopus japonicus TaxID=307972 RepID=A0A2G8LNX6_STIJA|nr:putative low-density lipoprotein receptor-related protein 4-like [Apostichopus japonicus]
MVIERSVWNLLHPIGLIVLIHWCRADCPDGYEQIRRNGCRDINECSASSERKCGQLCANEPGTFRCGCLSGYILSSDNTSCLVDGSDPVIYFRRRKDIAQVDPAGLDPQTAIRRVGNIRSFDVHYESKSVYWINGRVPSIGMSPLDENGRTEVFNIENLVKPESLKIDWIGHMIYWTDSKSKAIVRCSMNGTDQETVLTSQKKPKALVLDPIDRFVFWSTSGKAERIYRADFDGATRELIVREELELVVSLDVDIIDKRIYWLDQERGKIESVNYQGSYRTVLVSGIRTEATGLSLLADSIYWLGTNPPSVHRADIRTGRRQIRLRSNYFLSGQNNIVVMHQNKQPTGQQFYHGDCSSWNSCYNFPHQKRVSTNEPFVLFTTNNTVRKINQDGSNYNYVITKNVYNLVGVDYDPRVGKIFFADAGRGVIESANLDGTERRVIVNSNNIETVEGIALDWMHRQIYWTDSSLHHVAASSSHGGSIRILANTGVFQPRGITVYPALNWIYWTDIAEGASKIVASLHDGTYRRDIIDENLFYPNSITIDFVQNKLLWVDYGLSVIEQSSLEGLDRKVLFRLAESGHANIQPHSLEVFDKFIWYTNWRMTCLNPCNVFNGRCDHICTLAAENQATCSCRAGYQILEDGRTCLLDNPCESGDAVCGDNAFCLSDRSGGYTCICNNGYEHDLNYGCVEIKVPLLGPVLVTMPNRPIEPTTTPVITTTKEEATTLSSPETTTIEQVNKTTTEGCFLCRRLSTGSCKSNNSPTNCHPDGRVSTDLFLRRSTSYHQRGEHIDNPVYHPPRNNIQRTMHIFLKVGNNISWAVPLFGVYRDFGSKVIRGQNPEIFKKSSDLECSFFD